MTMNMFQQNRMITDTQTETVTLLCRQHGEFTAKIIWLEPLAKKIQSRCPQCITEENLREKNRLANKQVQEKILHKEQLWRQADLPQRFILKSFDDYHPQNHHQAKILEQVRAYASSFEDHIEQPKNLILTGKSGTGKTHLAVAVAKQLLEQNYSVRFISALRATRAIKEAYRPQAVKTVQQSIDAFIKSQLLILDEVGVQFGTDTERLILFEILNGRYEAVLPTIVITNLNESEFIREIGIRCFDRLQEGNSIVCRFNWDSYRRQGFQRPPYPLSC